MSGGDDEGHGGGREDFFHCLDRVPSGLHIDADFPSDDDDDDEDDVRVSFASAMGDRSFQSFRGHQAAVLEEEEEVEVEEEDTSKYDMWMADEPMSIQERRRRLHQGLGLGSSRDLALRRHSTKKRPADVPRSLSRPQSLASPGAITDEASAATATAPPPAVAAAARDVLEQQQPAKAITRRRSDSSLVVRGGASGSGMPPLPSLRHARSFPTRRASSEDSSPIEKAQAVATTRDLPAAALMAAPLADKGGKGDGGGKDGDDGESKKQDSGKEVAVVTATATAAPKDGSSNSQTGVQLGLEFIGNTPIMKHLMRRGQSQHQSQPAPPAAAPPKADKPAGKKKGGWLKNIKSVAAGLIHDKESTGKSAAAAATTAAASKPAPANAAGGGGAATAAVPASASERLKVHQYGKSCKELTGLYMCQEIQAHEGSIWSIKFSADGRRLASGGEDSVVRVWRVVETTIPPCSPAPPDGSSAPAPAGSTAAADAPATPALAQLAKKPGKGKSGRDTLPEHLVVPDKVFALAGQPACVLEGHKDDVLDLTWSKSDQLLSSSMDKTVRLWDTATQACLKTFAHSDYVTCIQFSPVDDRYFVSGSLDAKVRLWSIPDRQVVDWTDLNEMVTATSYTPDGQGVIIGSHQGSCRFYKTTDCKLTQEAQIDIQTKKRKSQAKKITGFQFAPGNPSEVLVTSADSQIRLFDGVTMVQKFRGFKNTSSQITAAYTADGRYAVCASEDSHVYLWRTARSAPPVAAGIGGSIGMKAKTWCTTRSYENFYCKDVSAAVPWPLSPTLPAGDSSGGAGGSPPSRDGSKRGAPACNDEVCSMASHTDAKPEPRSGELSGSGTPLTHSGQLAAAAGDPSSRHGGGKNADGGNAWGLVVATASLGGEIRVYQNFGMPFRIRGQGNLFY